MKTTFFSLVWIARDARAQCLRLNLAIDISYLADGMYIVELTDEQHNRIAIEKVVKQ